MSMKPIQFTIIRDETQGETIIKAIRGKIVYVTRKNVIQAVDLDEEPEAAEETLLTMPTYVFDQLNEFLLLDIPKPVFKATKPGELMILTDLAEAERKVLERWKSYLT